MKVLAKEVAELAVLEPSKSQAILDVFVPMAAQVAVFESEYSDIIIEYAEGAGFTPELSEKAAKLQTAMSKPRIAIEKERVKQKAFYLSAGRAIDAVAKIYSAAMHGKEANLLEIKKHAERLEAERITQLQSERSEALSFVSEDIRTDLGTMDSETWEGLLMLKTQQKADKIAAEKASEKARIKAEKEAIAERKRIEAENAKLKAEAAKAKAEADRIAAEAAKAEAARKKSEAEAKAKADAEAAKTKAEHEAALAKERAEAKRLADEIKAKADAEAAKAKAEADKIAAEFKAGDVVKMAAFADRLSAFMQLPVNNLKLDSIASEEKMEQAKNLLRKAYSLLKS